MKAREILTPQDFAAIVYGAANGQGKQQRTSALRLARMAVEDLLASVLKKLGKQKFGKQVSGNQTSGEVLESAKKYLFEPLFEVIVEGKTLEQRRKAAAQIAALYVRVFGLLEADEEKASGIVEDVTAQSEDAMEALLLCPTKEPAKKQPPPAAITVVKPGDESMPETVILSPDFARFLREQHGQPVTSCTKSGLPTDKAAEASGQPARLILIQLLTKKAFEEWLQEDTGKLWIKENCLSSLRENTAELYRIALHKAFQLYEQGAYQKEYCTPQRSAMPGIQYGHRLLRLPIALGEADFNDSEIYCGPVGNLQVPDVDFEELVRRYVNAMRLSAITIYNLDDITEDYVRRHFADQTLFIEPKRIELFQTAVMLALSSGPLLNFIRDARDQGRDITPEQVAEWLRGDKGSSVRTSILSGWERSYLLPGVGSGTFHGFVSNEDFRRLFVGLCAPNNPRSGGPGQVGPENAGAAYCSSDTTKWVNGGTAAITYAEKETKESFSAAVLNRIDRLVEVYEQVWQTARSLLAPADLPRSTDPLFSTYYSGYEFKSYVCWLAVKALKELKGTGFDRGAQ
ncbi:MAG: hypothetical protein EG828_11025, partial [Deltaproteobacteria bacterium]|nr:hypothetical protein [Deltaproteobacteria bacterium]